LVIAVFLAYLVVYLTVSNGVNAIGWLAAGRTPPWADYVARAGAYANPLGLWAGHLGLFALVLPVWAAYRFLHRRKLTWLWSISPGVRWRYGLTGLLAAVAVLGAVACFLAVSGPAWDPPANWPVFAIAIVLSSPLQALGEEVLFRGYLLQVLGLIVRRPWFPIVVSAALFGYFHGSQNLWLFLSRFAFGLVAGALVWRTGGLEAGIAAHAVNNVLAFGLALATGSLAETRATTEVAWSAGLRDVVVFAVFGALAWLLAWAMRLPNRAPALPSANRRG
jgi:membrane protease YdiL (CAAX protease family)